ncbi:hypothetical protein NDU88_005364 [Pleurodeles waltl]|uniref:Uncharacterized protein n=1 Tax=Pleurodeles waltl TaxID=8319 RepID=A0AAV7UHV4_PLEWA|nr:hypothetical protein NDU88_005364 [Pleurodeles waltl]
MDTGRCGSRSPAVCSAGSLPLRARRPCRCGHAVPGLPKMRLRPFCQALSAWGKSQVSCLTSRSCGVPGHDSVSPLLWGWGGSGPGVLSGCLLAPVS